MVAGLPDQRARRGGARAAGRACGGVHPHHAEPRQRILFLCEEERGRRARHVGRPRIEVHRLDGGRFRGSALPHSIGKTMRTHYCGAVTAADIGNTVTLCGWAHRRRDHGGVIFVDLRDREGQMQVGVDPDTPAAFKLAEEVRHEFVLKIEGKVRPRPAGTENANLPTGMVEVLTQDLEVLNASLTPPFQLDDEAVNENIRLQYRYLDLRREPMQKIMRLRYRVSKLMRDYLDANGFIEIETPMLTRSTPEGARDYLVPSRVHDGMFYALPQSPQLFKQL